MGDSPIDGDGDGAQSGTCLIAGESSAIPGHAFHGQFRIGGVTRAEAVFERVSGHFGAFDGRTVWM